MAQFSPRTIIRATVLIFALLGGIATLIQIATFVTGKNSLQEFLAPPTKEPTLDADPRGQKRTLSEQQIAPLSSNNSEAVENRVPLRAIRSASVENWKVAVSPNPQSVTHHPLTVTREPESNMTHTHAIQEGEERGRTTKPTESKQDMTPKPLHPSKATEEETLETRLLREVEEVAKESQEIERIAREGEYRRRGRK